MEREKEAKTIVIEGTCFIVNINRQVLVEKDNPGNEISFINQMQDCGDHYEMLYEHKERNAAPEIYDANDVIAVRIPPLKELDPDGMAEKYHITVAELKDKTDFEIVVDQQLFEQRRLGALPTIDIAGEPFVIDLRLQELRHARNFAPVISLRSLDLSDDGNHYQAFYHPVMKQVVSIDPKLTEFPPGVIVIKMPNELGLDPIATARKCRVDERQFLRHYPIQKDLKAEIIPLTETGIPALIQRNRQALRDAHEAKKKNHKLRRRPRL